MKSVLWLFLIVVLGLGTQKTIAYKILMVFPSFSQSHLIVAAGLLKGLAKKGHEVTMVSPFPQTKPLKNYRDIVIPLDVDKDAFMVDIVKGAGNPWAMFLKTNEMLKMSYGISNSTMGLPEFRKVMEEESFDLLILGMFANQYLGGLAYHFNCPVVVMSQVQAMYLTGGLVGNPFNVASSAHVFLGYHSQMTFRERVINFLVAGMELMMTQYLRSIEREYYDSNFPSDKFPSYDESLKNVSLLLVNHHVSQGAPRANVPAIVEIGGIHVEDEVQPLPEDIQEFLDTATDGAIFFSFGSNVKSSILPEHKLNAILKSFGKLKQKVLFKWETDNLPNMPSNMKIGKWMPQRDILAHKNLKLFVSHGGMGSIIESKYWGVPIVGIPFFGDQMGNMAAISDEGWAYQLNFDDLTEESFSKALEEVLTKPKYRETVRKIAELYKDRPQTALETANYWIEYVIRHKGAPHLQSHSVHLNFLQNNSIDVIAFLILILYLTVKFIGIIVKFCWRILKNKFTGKKHKQM